MASEETVVMKAPEVLDTSTLDQKADIVPRKRSKVSRACDSCRRKKIRCDAKYLTTLLRVTKICNNCSKNNEFCTFSRVPLKRGPSKGYIRDLVDRMDEPHEELKHEKHLSVPNTASTFPTTSNKPSVVDSARPRSKLVDAPSVTNNAFSPSGLVNSLASPHSSQPKPTLHRNPFSTQSANMSKSSLPIILPPLLGPQPLTQPVKLAISMNNSGVPSSPHTNSSMLARTPEIKDTKKILGPLWKVPYEMPDSVGAGLVTGESSAGSVNLYNNSRRSSVDSVSSILTTGSRSRLPSLKPLNSVNSELLVSDSDDEFYPARSRGFSASLSPRNSISSMLSLNGRLNKQLNLNNSVSFGPPPQQPVPPIFTQQPINQMHPSSPLGFPANTLDQNLRIYYNKFHDNLAILPFNESIIHRILSVVQSESGELNQLLQLFSVALNNLIHYQCVSFENISTTLHVLLLLYPLHGHAAFLKDEVLAILFSSLLMINYTVLMSGDVYSMAISMTAAVFNDFKVMENFAELLRNNADLLNPDDIRLHLPRLYLSLFIIDNCFSLSFGCQSFLPDSFDLLYDNLSRLIPPNTSSCFVSNVQMAKIFHILVNDRRKSVLSVPAQTRRYSHLDPSFDYVRSKLHPRSYSLFFVNLLKDKCELYDFLMQLYDYLKCLPASNFDDDIYETIIEHQLKITRLVKKLSQSLLSFANYVSTIYSQQQASLSMGNDLLSPFFNVSYAQSFKLIKCCKLLIDSFFTHASDGELVSRSVKINQDLSIAYNLLMSNLNNNYNVVKNLRATFSRGFGGGTPGLSSTSEQVSLKCLGFASISMISKKVELLKLDFSNCPSPVDVSLGIKKKNIDVWKGEYLESIFPFFLTDDSEGWY